MNGNTENVIIEQLTFADNGNIKPCPYRNECLTYPMGCRGLSYWCGRYEEEKGSSPGGLE